MKVKEIYRISVLWALTFLMVVTSCTDLEEQVIDEIVPDDIETVPGIEASLLSATYAKEKDMFANYGGTWALQEFTTDEALLPVRGEDWRDGGKWKELHEFKFSATSVVPEGNWRTINGAIAQAASAIDVIKDSKVENASLYLAEARALWAWYTFNLVDLFGQVPYRDPLNLNFADAPQILTSTEAIKICIETIEEVLPDLADYGTRGADSGRFTKEAAYAFLAKIYLNKAVYEDRYNATSSFDFVGSGNMDKVIQYTDLLINSGTFSLEADYFEIFDVSNNNNSEHILAYIQSNTGGNTGRNDFTYLSMGRNQKANPNDNRGSNASCTTPDYYATWDANRNDPRFHKHTTNNGGEVYRNDGTDGSLPFGGIFHFNRGFQAGQQYAPKITDGAFEMDPLDNSRVLVQALYTEKTPDLLMDFTPELNFDVDGDAAFSQDQINRGVRVFKQEYDAENGRGTSGVNIPLFRLGGIYTMRAEAKFRKGDVTGAMADINLLRTSRWSIDIDGNQFFGTEIATMDEETLYNEISYELYWEGERRQQMIRFGTFEDAYTAKPVSKPYQRIFAIPQSELDVNKDFVQNKDY
ncbi:RagB/SusD family nutrient uptake outer membrane protein [Reichenbachiella agarivorans]|uniref:RagB/SusD family nutrient uptake outer membrane protein n=1 Tax=Reichenbachiella agarivorans TaxID=2979464 RepID=A0ABY6CQQ2_9BACT|nr:RagB/SusD family nutrient uptake outer membrane protein [Reichenbachiella agarivorans]UXP32838.1 RagB/SusD family nutrient uptake outer membrane protein [Reichenbachiella agarivorans]